MTVGTQAPDSMTAADRCDRCGAQAYVRVELNSGDLFFCRHHSNEHLEALKPAALRIHDETARLEETAGSGE
ncbi:DUF7455 domain-containing protein [Spelaeicoccus albus]|uniref:DUF7455 domain-containing protein n=1 Tax=Spelaeicoccus albus TaxID=1280376 RepID=A0A7Z0D3H8_9MICO|nr:hypothetical protein [Spelaeicoccus albus]NYI68153.1 hypothetical protein [Spelaeicoccus albus]